ncbi:MAG: prepilin-type N-terminal cleavage/methylation domain-containing protein [bacterium]|nr:prepilin-type N-terminal cleavage/methylation domain-containing protein [bacterium]
MRAARTRRRTNRRQGFTLIEILTVIAIIGILVGLLIPAIGAARRYVANSAILFEAQTIANAVEQYKNKYGDYPPDGSNRAVFERHFRKAFPNMAATEFTILYQVANNLSGESSGLRAVGGSGSGQETVMDAAEALVFCLGGFSSDPTHPFTGPGGPITAAPAGFSPPFQYNVTRDNAMFEFKQEQLSLEVEETGSGFRTISVDEGILADTPSRNDLMPVYSPGTGRLAPFVYFDSRTYSFSNASSPGQLFFNVYYGTLLRGFARPYKSDNLNTNVIPNQNDWKTNDAFVRYANDNSFQIISAGLDDDYGGVAQAANEPPLLYKFPSGDAVDIRSPNGSSFSRYTEVPGIPSAQLDNVTNFADGILEDAMEN